MITVTVKEIMDSVEVMRSLSQKSLKGRVAYKVARMLRELDKELTLFNNTRENLIKQCGVKDAEGNLQIGQNGDYMIEPASVESYYNEINSVLSNTIELNCEKINLSDLEELVFTPGEMLALEPFIEE